MNRHNLPTLVALLLLLSIPASAQNSSNGSDNLNTSGLTNSRVYVDQAGLTLLENATPIDGYVVADEYILGSLDVLSIYGKGAYEFSYRALVVNASGDLSMPNVGLIAVKGLTVTEAKDKIIQAFGEILKNTEIRISVDQPKASSVHIGGEFNRPGNRLLPPGTRADYVLLLLSREETEEQVVAQNSLNTINSFTGVNFDRIQEQNTEALTFSPVIDEISSKYDLRNIVIEQPNGQIIQADLFAYLRTGKIKYNPFLYNGDQITLNKLDSYGDRISIGGAVQNPFDATYTEFDNIDRLIEISGGLLQNADTTAIVLNRDAESRSYSLNELRNLDLNPNDRVIIPFAEEKQKNSAVWVYGYVNYPGIYSIKDGESSLADVLELSGGLMDNALAHGAFLIKNDLSDRGVNQQVNLNLLTRSSDQFLEGFDYFSLEQALNPNRVPLNLEDSSILNSIKINDGDKIYIPEDRNEITLVGQFQQPGRYSYDSRKSVNEYVSNAGGYTIAADRERQFIIKAGSNAWLKYDESSLESGDILFVDRIPFEDVTSNRLYQVQVQNSKTQRIGLWLAGVSTLVSAITTIVVVTR